MDWRWPWCKLDESLDRGACQCIHKIISSDVATHIESSFFPLIVIITMWLVWNCLCGICWQRTWLCSKVSISWGHGAANTTEISWSSATLGAHPKRPPTRETCVVCLILVQYKGVRMKKCVEGEMKMMMEILTLYSNRLAQYRRKCTCSLLKCLGFNFRIQNLVIICKLKRLVYVRKCF